MKRHKCFENAIPVEVCQQIVDMFNTKFNLITAHPGEPGVQKILRPWQHVKDIIDPYLSKFLDTSDQQGGNIYKHSTDYGPHVDSDNPYPMVNCVIPLYVPPSEEQQHFVVFDQYVDNGIGQVWMCGTQTNLPELLVNSRNQLYPYQDDLVYDKVEGFDEEFYNKYLKHSGTTVETYKCLTGTAYEYKVGNLIVLDANCIHTTGRLVVPWKLGLLMQFKGTVEEIVYDRT